MRPLIAARRLGYRVAYNALVAYWFVARPPSHGVKCVLTDGERVLLVRHTYGPREWEVPGGAIKRREPAHAAARREMSEELGIDTAKWKSVGTISGRIHHRDITLHCFTLDRPRPQLNLDLGEIAAAEWFPRTQLPTNVGKYVKEALGLLER